MKRTINGIEYDIQPGANLFRANLFRANLEGANLSRANLFYAKLERANLKGVKLYDANLERANLEGANLEDAKLEGANLFYAKLEGANLEDANLRGAKLEGAYLFDAKLKDANLKDANLERANLEGANLEDAKLEDANLSRANLSRATGLLDPIAYIQDNFECIEHHGQIIGFYAYKSFNDFSPSPKSWIIESDAILTEVVNPSRVSDCASGINVATLEWCKQNCSNQIWRIKIIGLDMLSVVVPYHTDGKIRVGRCEIVGMAS